MSHIPQYNNNIIKKTPKDQDYKNVMVSMFVSHSNSYAEILASNVKELWRAE
jgi:hypothetical protein